MRLFLVALLTAVPAFAKPPADPVVAKVDAAFADYARTDAPGCAVAVARAGATVLEKGYGMANLEYDVPITPATIFEAGSVAKQFTAATIMMLANDGKLSIDDPVRKYIPELDPSASAITIRQMLSHTSGLRDWGPIVGLSGWPRGTRLITHAHILDILSRQHELNFVPGTQYVYNTGAYNVLAIVAERVSGKSFPDLTRERIFTPLGMTHSSWRDDHTRVVKGRATAYDPDKKGYVTDMDIEDIYGNCCLLTTVGDLLLWNDNFRTPKVIGRDALDQMQTPATLASGMKIDYGFGLGVIDEPGHREIVHTGATAGYRALLTRKLDDDLSIALLCNRGDAPLNTLADKMAAAFGSVVTPPPSTTTNEPASLLGLYRDRATNAIIRIVSRENTLHMAVTDKGSGPALSPLGDNRFRIGRTRELRFATDGLHLISHHKPEALYERVPEATPSAADLAAYAGRYESDEAQATWLVTVDAGKLNARTSPAESFALEPTYADGFSAGNGTLVHFTRDANGAIDGVDVKTEFSLVDGAARLERMHFVRRASK